VSPELTVSFLAGMLGEVEKRDTSFGEASSRT
jgi:hypothetical protein